VVTDQIGDRREETRRRTASEAGGGSSRRAAASGFSGTAGVSGGFGGGLGCLVSVSAEARRRLGLEHPNLVIGFRAMSKTSSRGASRGYRSGSVGRSLGRGHRRGVRSGRHGAFSSRKDRLLQAPSGARRPRPPRASALRVRPAGALHGDQGWLEVGGDSAWSPPESASRQRATGPRARGSQSDSTAGRASRCGASRGCAPPSSKPCGR
jgi:hypothetical protein